MTVRAHALKRFLSCLLLFMTLALPALAQAPAPTEPEPGPTPPLPRTLAILIIGDAHNDGMTNIEKRLTQDILQRREKAAITSHALPIIFYHMDKPSERRYCEQKLGIHADHLLVAAIVEHQNYVVKSVLFKVEKVQLPEIAAQQLMDQAQTELAQDQGPGPLPTGSPVLGENTPVAFFNYTQAIAPIETQRAHLEQVARQGATMPPPQYQQMLGQDVIPALRDLVAMAEKLPQGSPEVATLHGMYLEGLRYQLKSAEARQEGLQANSDTEKHLADNYDQLSAMARSRYTLETQRLQLKYPPR